MTARRGPMGPIFGERRPRPWQTTAALVATVGLAPFVAFPVLESPFQDEASSGLSTRPCFACR